MNEQLVPPVQSLIEAIGLSRRDERNGTVLLHPCAFSLAPGDRVALTGPSGSGKSVLLRTLALLDATQAGEVRWQGERIGTAQIPAYRARVCYIAQKPALLDGSVEDNLRYPFSLKVHANARFQRERVLQLLASAGKPATFLDQLASDLSGGEAQILALIRALQLAPQVLLLDEPTAALDPTSARQVEALVDAWFTPARALIWVSHDPQQAERVSNRQQHMNAGTLS